ncbi:MAG: hypothetical protein WDM79_08725 [Terricaulis sp.]
MDAESTPRAFHAEGRNWFRDFRIGVTGLVVKKTGARVPYSPSVIADLLAWFRFFFAAKAMAPLGAPFTIAFTPERARPWYLIWPTVHAAGGRLVKDAAQADVVMHFDDATFSPNPPPAGIKADARLINFGCRDVSKSKVAEAFEAAFGYPLAIDPATYVGPAVEKSEINGAHDGRIVQCPTLALRGRTYQRVVDARGQNPELVEDLRTPTLGGKPACVFIKRRPVTKRFANANSEVEMARVEAIFSADEMAKIEDFARRLGLDWGGLDVLRDKGDGRLYIVDANKTDMGPPIALPLSDKLVATRLLATAFREFVSRPAG